MSAYVARQTDSNKGLFFIELLLRACRFKFDFFVLLSVRVDVF